MRIAHRVTLFLLVLAFAFSPSAHSTGNNPRDLAATPQAKAYGALLKAVDAEDFEAYKKCMTKAAAKGIDQQMKDTKMDSKKVMGFLKAMSPKDLKFTSLNVEGKKATLEATGKIGDELNKGTIALEEEDGQWKVANQSWTNAK